jgi:catechol 2,3-dioxygenase-like lactoylglutathione lyase family enzyme
MRLSAFDHLVLTVRNIEISLAFYADVLGMEIISFAGDRKALRFGDQKINLHQQGREFEPKADKPTPGSADLCFLTDMPIAEVIRHLERHDIEIIAGPVERTGARGPILSVYLRDPDENLLELANPL